MGFRQIALFQRFREGSSTQARRGVGTKGSTGSLNDGAEFFVVVGEYLLAALYKLLHHRQHRIEVAVGRWQDEDDFAHCYATSGIPAGCKHGPTAIAYTRPVTIGSQPPSLSHHTHVAVQRYPASSSATLL